MYTYRERIIKFNGIQLSKTGFKDLKFETSRYSDSLNTIRGFGAQMNESNLSVVDTISVDFILKTDELADLAYIYCMFKAIGVLPIENEYLINKVSDTLSRGNETKYKFTHLLCFLERLQITSLEKTSNGYDVNMILTLYQNSFVGDQYKEFEIKFEKWKKDTDFFNICNKYTKNYSENLNNTGKSGFNISVYNVEKLNTYYKENILDTEKINKLYNGDDEISAAIKENRRIDFMKRSLPEEDEYKPYSFTVDNKHIIQIELITSNLITNFPMKGKPIGYKSFLGIGKSTFGLKMLFKESENSIVQELKNISDKNIINHKLIINHPLVQLFDFYSSDITNMTFNNIESANGIIVTMLFNVTGFNYDKDEELLNSSDIILKKCNTNNYITESISGLYLEHLADYLYKNRRNNVLSLKNIKDWLMTTLEGKYANFDDNGDIGYDKYIREEKYYLIDFLASYSSSKTSFGYHSSDKDELVITTRFGNTDVYNKLVNKNKKVEEQLDKNASINIGTDVFDVKYTTQTNGLNNDPEYTHFRSFYDLINSYNIYSYLDSVAIYMIVGDKRYNKKVWENLYKQGNANSSIYLMENVINNLGVELFNTKQNAKFVSFGICSKIYEEFYYRLFDIYMNMNLVSDDIEQLSSSNFVYTNGDIDFVKIHNSISFMVSDLLHAFVSSIKDERFIERIIVEIDRLYEYNDEEYEGKVAKLNKETFTDLLEELYNELSFSLSQNKNEIIDKIYNIFLTKLNYFLIMYISSNNDAAVYENTKLSINTQIKILLLSSCSFAPLLMKNKYRTDHFGENITIGSQNLGEKLKKYNKHLEGFDGTSNLYDSNQLQEMYKKNNENEIDSSVYQLFTTLFGKRIPSYYLTILSNGNINQNDSKYLTYDEVIKKDCLYFYGNKIPRYDLYVELENVINTKEKKEAFSNVSEFLVQAKEDFKNGSKYCSTHIEKFGSAEQDYGFNSLGNIQRFHYSDIASYRKELFLSTNEDGSKTYLNDIMKNRIIGHNDMFYNLDNITKVITDSSNAILPDYVISIIKKHYTSEYAGETNTYIDDEYELFANNISSISITKDPKTKIKTATIEIINVKKHILSVGEDGSFNVKEMNDGKVEVLKIEPGDEIRVKLGYLHSNNVFNGVIKNIQYGNNIMVLTCTSFASLLYNINYPDFGLTTVPDSFQKHLKKNAFNNFEKVLDINEFCSKLTKKLSSLSENYNDEFNTNNHLFNIFNKLKLNNPFYYLKKDGKSGMEAGMFMFASFGLRLLPRRILEKLDGKLSNITSSKLVNNKIIIKDGQKVMGATAARDEQTITTLLGSTFKNLNNLDNDYETYGITTFGSSYPIKVDIQKEDTYIEEKQETPVDNEKPSSEPIQPEQENPIVETAPTSNGLLTTFPCTVKRITELKGKQRVKIDKKGNKKISIHKGLDIGKGGQALDVLAAGDGIIEQVFNSSQEGGGRYLKIKHEKEGKTLYTCYMHLLKGSLINPKTKEIWKKGENVTAGTVIAKIGGSGFGSETTYVPHLHFEVRTASLNNQINPLDKDILPYFEDLRFKSSLKNDTTGSYGQYAGKAVYVG